MKFEIKNAGIGAVEDVDTTGRRIVLYAASFNNVDSHDDIIQPGAFTKTLAENYSRIKHLWQHDTEKPVGKPESMVEDQKGLLVTSLISDTQLGRDLLTLVADGVMSENSIGFQTVKSSTDETKDVRTIQEVKLYEYSSVTWGSNEMTPNVGIKSLSAKEQFDVLNKQFNKIKKAVRGGNFHDDTYALLEVKLVQMQAEVEDLFATSLGVTEPEIKAGKVDVTKAKAWLSKAIALHEKHMDGTIKPDAASQEKMMTQMKSAYQFLGGDMSMTAEKSTLLLLEPNEIQLNTDAIALFRKGFGL